MGNMSLKKLWMENAFCHPKGIIGQVGGTLMSFDRELPIWILSLLKIESTDKILEVGFGPGVAIDLASSIAKHGKIIGVDSSDKMITMASKRNSKKIEDGLIKLYKAPVHKLPCEDNFFDVAITINSLHIWSDPVMGLKEIRRTLKNGARVVVAITRYSKASFDPVDRFLKEAGFKNIQRFQDEKTGTCLIGFK